MGQSSREQIKGHKIYKIHEKGNRSSHLRVNYCLVLINGENNKRHLFKRLRYSIRWVFSPVSAVHQFRTQTESLQCLVTDDDHDRRGQGGNDACRETLCETPRSLFGQELLKRLDHRRTTFNLQTHAQCIISQSSNLY